MRILSNTFPTNMPDSEKVSQGGPANFARLFKNYIVSHTKNVWLGLLFDNSTSGATDYQKINSFQQRDYYRLRFSKFLLRSIVLAKKKCDPEIILKEPIKQIVKLIRAEKPDVIFLNGFGLYNWMLLKAGEITKVPVVIQHAGIWTKELAIHKKLYTVEGRKAMENMERDSTQIVSHEIFLNEWSKKYYQTNIAKGEAENTSVVPLPFDFTSFKKVNTEDEAWLFNFDKKLYHIGIVARWDEIKNHKAILAMAKLAKRKKLPWTFHAVVDIPDTCGKKKETYLKNVDVIPSLDRAGISQFCDAVDLLVLPSIFDVSPTVVLEAIASGTPVAISPNVGFAHDFEVYGGNKWVLNFSNISETMNRIKKLLGKKMPKKLINNIKSKHKFSKVFGEYLRIFKNVAKASR